MACIEFTGEVETHCRSNHVRAGDAVELIFRAEEDPPFTVRIRDPSGTIILERVLRELPTGKPQSAPPVKFTATAAGKYKIEVWQLYGSDRGEATLTVDEPA